MNAPARISVIIPTCNRPDLIARAIDSVLSQKYPNLEILIVDDNQDDSLSRQQTSKVVSEYKLDYLHFIENNNRKGPSFSRNLGISNAKGDYIAFLDDDDEWLPSKIEKQLAMLEQYPACLTAAENVFDQETKISFPKKRGFITKADFYRGGSLGGQIQSLIFRKDVLKKLSFEENVHISEDNIFMMSILKTLGSLGYIDSPLVRIYRNTDNLSAKNKSLDYKKALSAFDVSSNGKRILGDYYPIILARVIIGANLSLKDLAPSKILSAIRTCGLSPVLKVMYFKFLNFFTRKIFPKYY